jgi:hypothetical protein
MDSGSLVREAVVNALRGTALLGLELVAVLGEEIFGTDELEAFVNAVAGGFRTPEEGV